MELEREELEFPKTFSSQSFEKPSWISFPVDPSIAITHIFIMNSTLQPFSLSFLIQTFQSIQIPYEIVQMIPFKHHQQKLLDLPSSSLFHHRTNFNLEKVLFIIEKRTDLSWEIVSEWQTYVQLYLKTYSFYKIYSPNEKLQKPFLIFQDQMNITSLTNSSHSLGNLLNWVSVKFLNEVLPTDRQIFIVNARNCTCNLISSSPTTVNGTVHFCRVARVEGVLGYIVKNLKALLSLIGTFNTSYPRKYDVLLNRLFTESKLNIYCVS